MKAKSGSGAEENSVSSLKGFNEMSFLDNSIIIRKSIDNSIENNISPASSEEFEESISDENFENNTSKCFKSNIPKQAPTNNIDKALEKLLEENENEFVAFGTSVAQQLQKVPVEGAYELMGDVQNLITQRKIRHIIESRTATIITTPQTSTATGSDIVNLALANADVHLDNDSEYDNVI